MAGYSGYAKSNNAVTAEKCNVYPATAAAKKLGVKAAAIKELLRPCEYHHTSSWYNATDYYDIDLLSEVKAGKVDDADEDELAAKELLSKLQAWRPPQNQERIYAGCTVEWIVWGGSRRWPKAYPQTAKGATVTVNGSFAIIEIPTQKSFRKKLGANGFFVRDAAGTLIF